MPVTTLQFVAFDSIMRKKMGEALETIEYAIKKYPKDGNNYNILGILHEKSDQLEKSKNAFLKACQKGEENKDSRLIFFKNNLKRLKKKLKR